MVVGLGEELMLEYVLAAAMALVLVVSLHQGRSLQRLGRRLHEAESRNRVLEKDLTAVLACSRGLAQRVQEQRRHLKQVERNPRPLAPVRPLTTPMSGETQYSSARLLLERGASTSEVARNCGLSQGEVELLARMGRKTAYG